MRIACNLGRKGGVSAYTAGPRPVMTDESAEAAAVKPGPEQARSQIISMDYLSKLENQSIYIIREAFNKFENMAMLWSIGKDSTVLLWLARKAFFGHVPFPLVHVDTTYKIPSMIEYRDQLVKNWKLKLVVGKNEEVLKSGATF